MENIVFVSSHLEGLDYHAQEERGSQLRREIINMGLDFHPVKINDKKYFMVRTNLLGPMKALAKKFDQDIMYISDSRRTTFVVSLADSSPTKLGTLKRSSVRPTPSAGNSAGGTFCLIVSENNKDYYYIVE